MEKKFPTHAAIHTFRHSEHGFQTTFVHLFESIH